MSRVDAACAVLLEPAAAPGRIGVRRRGRRQGLVEVDARSAESSAAPGTGPSRGTATASPTSAGRSAQVAKVAPPRGARKHRLPLGRRAYDAQHRTQLPPEDHRVAMRSSSAVAAGFSDPPYASAERRRRPASPLVGDHLTRIGPTRPTAGRHAFEATAFIARLVAHIPDKGQVMQRAGTRPAPTAATTPPGRAASAAGPRRRPRRPRLSPPTPSLALPRAATPNDPLAT